MPWKEETLMSIRAEFVQLAEQKEASFRQLCREFGISRKTGYKWLHRFREGGIEALQDQSRRPKQSPNRTPPDIENQILQTREEFPAWGGRKIKAYLERKGHQNIPAPSTITEILKRYNQIDPEEAQKHKSFQSFEMEYPNQLWQMDFKGYFSMEEGGDCHPLTVLDDHSRFLIGLKACPNETRKTVQSHLCEVFSHFGLPECMLMDNGSPWGYEREHSFTGLTAWLMRLGVKVIHGRPYHPQTQGKDERLHRTLNTELLIRTPMLNLEQCQIAFNQWRDKYNGERPHEALQMETPQDHYHPSSHLFPEVLPPLVYPPGHIIRKVDKNGIIYFNNQRFRVGKAFRNQLVGLLQDDFEDDVFQVFFCEKIIAKIDLKECKC
jgi:transposase InsO family protein